MFKIWGCVVGAFDISAGSADFFADFFRSQKY